jgi:hypothetical protein
MADISVYSGCYQFLLLIFFNGGGTVLSDFFVGKKNEIKNPYQMIIATVPEITGFIESFKK